MSMNTYEYLTQIERESMLIMHSQGKMLQKLPACWGGIVQRLVNSLSAYLKGIIV